MVDAKADIYKLTAMDLLDSDDDEEEESDDNDQDDQVGGDSQQFHVSEAKPPTNYDAAYSELPPKVALRLDQIKRDVTSSVIFKSANYESLDDK